MKTRITLLQRNNFKDKDNKDVKYCFVYFVSEKLDDENNKGSVISRCSTRYENYEKIHPFVGKDCDIEFEYTEKSDGSFKRKITKIDNVVLDDGIN